MTDTTPFAKFLLEQRHSAGLSARAVARQLGLSHVAYGNVERGKQDALAEAYWPALMDLYPGTTRGKLQSLAEASASSAEVDLSGLSAESRLNAHEIVRALNRLEPEQLHRMVLSLEGSDGRVGTASRMDEKVPRVPGLSRQDLVELGDELLRSLQPEALRCPTPVDVRKLVDSKLEEVLGIHVYPVHPADLPADAEASTSGERILVRKDQYDLLREGGPMGLRARATIAHELGHAILHSPMLADTETAKRVTLVPRRELKAYEDPEWQAWTLAQAFLIPVRTARSLSSRTPEVIADTYQVSLPFAEGYLRRFRSWMEI